MPTYDVIIVGAGMAGLYTAFLLKSRDPTLSLLILEQNGKPHLGGRANSEMFYGTKIAIGAGIGRHKKDKWLAALMRHYEMPVKTYTVDHHMATSTAIGVPETMHKLQKEYEIHKTQLHHHPQTFAQFARRVLGDDDYKRFLSSTGFTDYEQEDAYETLYEYGMEDNLGGWSAFSVPWHDLVHALAKSIDTGHFMYGKKVIQIRENAEHEMSVKTRSMTTNHVQTFEAKKVVIATTVDTVRHLLPRCPMYKEIEGQPFLRVYGKFDKSSVGILQEVVPKFTYVDFPVQKIIPINVEKGVYMIVYNDNAGSLALRGRVENTRENCVFYGKLLEKVLRLPVGSLQLLAIRAFYWKYGTHYYKPLDTEVYKTREAFMKQTQRPRENVFVVGELVSRNQGWVEGALESVREVIREI